jgi:hypothetical protein
MAGPGTTNRGSNNGEFHRADPVYRRQMQVFLAVTAVAGILGVVGLQWWLRKLGTHAQAGDLLTYQAWLHRLLGALCLLLDTAAGGFALWLRRIAADSRRERRWPPSNMRTSADVRIRYLTSADTLVTQLQAAAIALGVLAVALCGWAIWLLLFAT